tara:strand:- start:454 stop:660 length:207 start_codon:yes stop_codon:yes gene_type:complete
MKPDKEARWKLLSIRQIERYGVKAGEVVIVPQYYYFDKDGKKVYDTDLMFQDFEEEIEELIHEEEQRS